MLMKLMVGIVDGQKIYFDLDGRLYEKHPVLTHYEPTLYFVYQEYGFKGMRLQCPEFVHVGYNPSDLYACKMINNEIVVTLKDNQ